MSFENLPQNWPELPLHDPTHAADVVDLLVKMSDRACDSLLLLPADENGVPYPTPMLFSGCDWRADPQGVVEFWSHLTGNFQSVVIATSHRDRGCPGQHRSWLTRVRNGIAALGTPVLGCYTAALDGVHVAT